MHYIIIYYDTLTLNSLTWKIWWAPNNASKWQIGFNSAFKGLSYSVLDMLRCSICIYIYYTAYVILLLYIRRYFCCILDMLRLISLCFYYVYVWCVSECIYKYIYTYHMFIYIYIHVCTSHIYMVKNKVKWDIYAVILYYYYSYTILL